MLLAKDSKTRRYFLESEDLSTSRAASRTTSQQADASRLASRPTSQRTTQDTQAIQLIETPPLHIKEEPVF